MSCLADTWKRDHAERMAFQSNMALEVRSMLLEARSMLENFAGTRSDMARKAKSDRKAFVMGLKKLVWGRTMPETHKVKAVESPVTVKEPRRNEENGWLRETVLREKPGKAAAKSKRGKKR
jgi:hypothetical protein